MKTARLPAKAERKESLAKQAKSAARGRTAAERSASAKKAAATKGPAKRNQAAKKAVHTKGHARLPARRGPDARRQMTGGRRLRLEDSRVAWDARRKRCG